jgi:hypothetical protein
VSALARALVAPDFTPHELYDRTESARRSWSTLIGEYSPTRLDGLAADRHRRRSQGAGISTLLVALTKASFGTLEPKFRPEGAALSRVLRLYDSAIGVAVVQIFFYNNTQAIHLALAKNLAPYGSVAHITESIGRPELASLNDMTTT